MSTLSRVGNPKNRLNEKVYADLFDQIMHYPKFGRGGFGLWVIEANHNKASKIREDLIPFTQKGDQLKIQELSENDALINFITRKNGNNE